MTASLQGKIEIQSDSINDALKRINDLNNKLKEITAATKAFERAEKSYNATTDATIAKLKQQVSASKEQVKQARAKAKANQDAVKVAKEQIRAETQANAAMDAHVATYRQLEAEERSRNALLVNNTKLITAQQNKIADLTQAVKQSNLGDRTKNGLLSTLASTMRDYSAAVQKAEGDVVELTSAGTTFDLVTRGVSRSLKEKTAAIKEANAVQDKSRKLMVDNATLTDAARNRVAALEQRIGKANLERKDEVRLTQQVNDAYGMYAAAVQKAEGDTVALKDAKRELNNAISSARRGVLSFTVSSKDNQSQLIRNEQAIGSLTLRYQQSAAAIKTTTLSQQEQERQLKILEQNFERTKNTIQDYGAGTLQAVRANNAFRQSLVRSSDELRKNLAGVGRGAGQAGIQVQQFVGQIQGGIDPMIALSQQSADLGWALGMPLAGAIAGIAFSMGTFLAPAMFDGKDAADYLEESLQRLDSTARITKGGILELSDEIQDLAQVSQEAALAKLRASMYDAQMTAKNAAQSIIESFDTLDVDYGLSSIEDYTGRLTQSILYSEGFKEVSQELGQELGFTGDKARETGERFLRMMSAVRQDPSVENFEKLRDAFTSVLNSSNTVSDGVLKIVNDVLSYGEAARKAGVLTKEFEQAQKDLNAWLTKNSDDSKEAISSLDSLINSTITQARTLGMSERELAIYNATLNKATDEQIELLNTLYDGIEARKDEIKAEKNAEQQKKQLAKITAEYNAAKQRENAFLTASTQEQLKANLAQVKARQNIEAVTGRISMLTGERLKDLAVLVGVSSENKTHEQLLNEVTQAYIAQTTAMTDNERAARALFDLRQMDNKLSADQLPDMSALVNSYQQQGAAATQAFRDAIAKGDNVDEATALLQSTMSSLGTAYTNELNALQLKVQQTVQFSPLSDTERLRMDFEQRKQTLAEIFGEESELYSTHLASLQQQYKQQSFHMEFAKQFGVANDIIGGAMQTFQSLGKQNSREYKNLAIGQAIIQQAMAVNSVWADPSVPFWGKIGLSAMAGAQVAAQIKQIRAQSFATGGYVSGAGTATSDSIPARLSNGEYVINAAATRMLGTDVLDQLNKGHMPMLASGGFVGTNSASGGNFNTNITVELINQSSSNVEVGGVEQFTDQNGEPKLRAYIRDVVRTEMNNGQFDKALKNNYGQTRKPIRR